MPKAFFVVEACIIKPREVTNIILKYQIIFYTDSCEKIGYY